MVGIAVASLLGRLVSVPLIFLFVHSPGDTALAAAIQGGTTVISTAASLYLLSRHFELGPVEPSLRGAMKQLSGGARLFFMTAGINLYTQGNTVILGAVSGPVEAGLFGGADRIRRALQGLTGPISTAVLPRVSRLVKSDMASARRIILNTLLIQGGGALAFSAVAFLGAQPIIVGLLGSQFAPAADVLRVLSPAPFLVGLNNVLALNIMLPLGLTRELMAVTYISGIFNVMALIPLAYLFGAVGAAGAVSATEAVALLVCAVSIARSGALNAQGDAAGVG
jgi:O-antigen/teichoic acid export membrane protein